MDQQQSDQIGILFAQWAIVYFGQLFKNDSSSRECLSILIQSLNHVLISTKKWNNGLGHTLGDFYQKLIRSPWIQRWYRSVSEMLESWHSCFSSIGGREQYKDREWLRLLCWREVPCSAAIGNWSAYVMSICSSLCEWGLRQFFKWLGSIEIGVVYD
jgi:hypothetical protein